MDNDLNITGKLSQEDVSKVDPFAFDLKKFQSGTAMGPGQTQQYVEGAIAPELAKEQWSKNFQLRKWEGKEKVDLGHYALDTKKAINREKMIGQTVGDLIKAAAAAAGGAADAGGGGGMAAAAYRGYSDAGAGGGMAADVTNPGDYYQPFAPANVDQQSFWQSPLGAAFHGAGAYMYNPNVFKY